MKGIVCQLQINVSVSFSSTSQLYYKGKNSLFEYYNVHIIILLHMGI
jgi:hypothetical protein